MQLVEVIIVALGSTVLVEVVKQIFNKNTTKAKTTKLNKESAQLTVDAEFKVSEFYKVQLQEILEKYNQLEAKLDKEILEHQACENQIKILQSQYQELQRQFTLLKTNLSHE